MLPLPPPAPMQATALVMANMPTPMAFNPVWISAHMQAWYPPAALLWQGASESPWVLAPNVILLVWVFWIVGRHLVNVHAALGTARAVDSSLTFVRCVDGLGTIDGVTIQRSRYRDVFALLPVQRQQRDSLPTAGM